MTSVTNTQTSLKKEIYPFRLSTKMKFITLLSLFAMTSAFAPVHQQTSRQQLIVKSTVDKQAQDTKSQMDDEWLAEQFHLVHPSSVIESSSRADDNDWFNFALKQGATTVDQRLQIKGNDVSALQRNNFHGILPSIPPAAPALASLQNYHLEPDFQPVTTAFLKVDEATEWFSQTIPAIVKAGSAINRKGLQQGENEWFSTALNAC